MDDAARSGAGHARVMLIALLVVLGIDLIVIVAVVAFIVTRRRWVLRQPGAFRGAIRVGDANWQRGHGRWVRDVLVWTKAPFLFQNELLAADALESERPASPGEFKRLGDDPAVIRLDVAGVGVEVAARGGDESRLRGPYTAMSSTAARTVG